jgi:acetyl esterase/lipase
MQSTSTGAPRNESWFRFHSLTTQDRSTMAAFRTVVEPNKGKLRGTAARGPFDAVMSSIIAPQGVTFRVQAGDDEVLLEDSLRFVERAVAAGVDARLDVWEGMPHGFVSGIGQTQAAASGLSAIGKFLSPRLATGSGKHFT